MVLGLESEKSMMILLYWLRMTATMILRENNFLFVLLRHFLMEVNNLE